MNCIVSDYWKPYQSIIPQEKHIQSKKETFTIVKFVQTLLCKNETEIKVLYKRNGNVGDLNPFVDVL